MNHITRHCVIFLLFMLSAITAHAEAALEKTTKTVFGQYTVGHVVFNSTFIQPEVAAIYQLKRSKYESLLNISVNKEGQSGSIPALISGTVTNLMQQQKQLKLKEISEKNATYYLAPIRIANEEVLHFELTVRPEGSSKDLHIKFTQKVYADE